MKRNNFYSHNSRGGKISKMDNVDGNIRFPNSEAELRSRNKRTRNGTAPFQGGCQRSFESVSRTNLSEEAGVKPLSPEKKKKHIEHSSICIRESHGQFTPEMFRSQYGTVLTANNIGLYLPQVQAIPESFFVFKSKQLPDENLQEDKFSKLPDEMILRVLNWVPRTNLGVVARVNRRLNRLSKDDTLWKRLDACGRSLSNNHLNVILSRKPVYLKCAHADMSKLQLEVNQSCNQLTHLDLSMANVRPDILAQIFSNAPNISHLSLEHLAVNDNAVNAMKTFAKSVKILNLAMVYDIPAKPFAEFLYKTSNLQEMNMSNIKQKWNNENFMEVINSLPATIERLNISGFRNQLKDPHVRIFSQKCQLLKHLDVSDCQELTEKSVRYIVCELLDLQHLALSRCYNVEPAAYQHLHGAKSLRFLDLFTLFKDSSLKTLTTTFPGVQINTCMFSTVARPTTGVRLSSIWGQKVRD